jgi:hypothetical protein
MYYSSKYRDQPKKKAELFWGRTKKRKEEQKQQQREELLRGQIVPLI